MNSYYSRDSKQSEEPVIYASSDYVGDHIIEIDPEDEMRYQHDQRDQSVLFDPEDNW